MAFSIIYSVVDAKNKRSTFEVNLPSSTAFADVVEFAGDLAALIDPLITGKIERIGIAFTVDLPGTLASVADIASDVEEGAKFIFNTVNGFATSLRLPTFSESFIVDGTAQVDTADAAVIAFVNAMEEGLAVTGGTVQPSDKRDEDIVSIRSSAEQFLSSRGTS